MEQCNNLQFIIVFYKLLVAWFASQKRIKRKPKYKTTKNHHAPKMNDDNFDVLNEAIQMYLHIV